MNQDAAPTGAVREAVARLPKAAVIVLLLILLPAVVGGLLGGPAGAAGLIVGLLGGLVGSLGRGYSVARAWLPFLAVALVVGGVTTGTWWWVAAVTVFAAIAGWSVAWGLMPLCALAAIVMVTAKPLEGLSEAFTAFVFVLIGGALGTEAARRAGAPAVTPGHPEARRVAAMAAVALGLAAGVAAAIGFLLDSERGYWIAMTVLILAQPAPEGRGRKTRDRLIGTVAGILVLVPLAALGAPRVIASVLALLSVLLIIAVSTPYWLRVTFITTTVILVLAPPQAALAFAGRRLGETVIGAAILVIAALGLLWWARRGRDPLMLPETADAS